MRQTKFAYVATALFASSFAVQAFSEPLPPAPGFPSPREFHEAYCADQEALFKSKIAFVEVKLDLQLAQRSNWETFVSEARAAEEPLRALCADNPPPSQQDVITSLETDQHRLEALLQTHRAMVGAVKKFISVLSAEQQRTLALAIRHPQPPLPGFGSLPSAH